jgi:hypothetical protein
MKIVRSNWNDFIEVVQKQKYQNQDIIEATQLGYKSIEDAYRSSELAWARFYIIMDKEAVIATILEQRDGVFTLFTTTNLPSCNIRDYIRTIRELSDEVVKCRDVVFTQVVSWYKPAMRILKLAGFRPHIKYNRRQIWVKEHGKQEEDI